MTTNLLSAEFTKNLFDHAVLVSKGVDSEQAATITFSNEEDLADIYAQQKSYCCNAPVAYDDLQRAYCENCGNFCKVL